DMTSYGLAGSCPNAWRTSDLRNWEIAALGPSAAGRAARRRRRLAAEAAARRARAGACSFADASTNTDKSASGRTKYIVIQISPTQLTAENAALSGHYADDIGSNLRKEAPVFVPMLDLQALPQVVPIACAADQAFLRRATRAHRAAAAAEGTTESDSTIESDSSPAREPPSAADATAAPAEEAAQA
ncbi:unnamed protein product, partial [Prorocentrum cordatum]